MNSMSEILQKKFAQNTQNKPEVKETYESESKEPKFSSYCEICKEPTEKQVWCDMFKYWSAVHVLCKCEKEAISKQRFKSLMSASLLGDRYQNATFESSKNGVNKAFDEAFSRCKKYCEIHGQVYKNGEGIYLYGSPGTGKTHITACMANELMKNGIPVLFTSLFEISKTIKSTFNRNSEQNEQDLINKFSSINFLFFDDLGTEIFTKNQSDSWLNGLLFDLINRRYNAKKPTIFSSNYSLNDLINLRGVMDKTIDRILEMTSGAMMRITGDSWRMKKKEVNF